MFFLCPQQHFPFLVLCNIPLLFRCLGFFGLINHLACKTSSISNVSNLLKTKKGIADLLHEVKSCAAGLRLANLIYI